MENFLGFGLGLRPPHYDHILEHRPNVDWFEVISENYMVAGGKPKYYLHAIREHYPMVMHGVSLSIGSADPLNIDYLKRLRSLAAEIEPAWISDHLCWTGVADVNSHDLLPMPYTEESLNHVVDRVKQVQDFLGRRILLENPSSYVEFDESYLSEVDFLSAVATQADCLLLLDINNIYVSARNHGFDAVDYIHRIDAHRVQQFHLAGHTDYGDYVIDTHDHDIRNEVWALYREALEYFGPVSTMIERDDNIPPFEALEAELNQSRQIFEEVAQSTTSIPVEGAIKKYQSRCMTTSNLIRTQHIFMQYLLTGVPTGVEPLLKRRSIDTKTGMHIYYNAYRQRFKETIETDHEILGLYLGDALFDQMVAMYTQQYPSSYVSLRDFSQHLPALLVSAEPFKQYPILAEIAHFERLLLAVFDAPDAESATLATLQSMAPELWPNMQLRMHPSMQIFQAEWNSVETWQMLKAGESPHAANYQPASLWLMWRGSERLTEFRSMPAEELDLLNAILHGSNFSALCEVLSQYRDVEESPAVMLNYLANWLSNGMVSSIEVR